MIFPPASMFFERKSSPMSPLSSAPHFPWSPATQNLSGTFTGKMRRPETKMRGSRRDLQDSGPLWRSQKVRVYIRRPFKAQSGTPESTLQRHQSYSGRRYHYHLPGNQSWSHTPAFRNESRQHDLKCPRNEIWGGFRWKRNRVLVWSDKSRCSAGILVLSPPSADFIM